MKMKERKGTLELTSTSLTIIIFAIVAAAIFILIWLSLTRDAPAPISDFFFRLFDWASSMGSG